MAKRRLQRTKSGAIMLPNKKVITVAEQKRLQRAVRTANRKRAEYYAKTPASRIRYNIFGVESDFIHRKKSAGFSRFRNRSEFLRYLHSVEKIASGYAERRRAEIYRENYKKALRVVFGDKLSLPARKAINKMSLDEFIKKVENEEIEEIGYVYYDPDNNKLNKINLQLGVA